MKTIFDFDFEALSIFKVLGKYGPGIIQKTITGLFPLTWQDGIGGDLVDYSLTGKTELSGVKNQLVQNGNFVDVSGWDGTSSFNISVENNVLSISMKSIGSCSLIRSDITLISGHKYLYSTEIYSNESFSLRYFIAQIDKYVSILPNEWNSVSEIVTANSNLNRTYFYYFDAEQVTLTKLIQIKNCMLVDLTALVGAGQEPTTTAEAKQLIARVMNHGTPLDYYPYDSGTPYSIGVGDYGGKRNQLCNKNYVAETGSRDGITVTNNNDGTISFIGTSLNGSQYQIAKNIPIVPNHTYLFHNGNEYGTEQTFRYDFWKNYGNDYIASEQTSPDMLYTFSNGDVNVGFYLTFAQGATIEKTFYPQIFDLTAMFPNDTPTDVATAKSRIAEVMGGQQEYYPYDSGTDYYKLPMVVTSGGCVDLGTLNWDYDEYNLFRAYAPNMKEVGGGGATGIGYCSMYKIVENWGGVISSNMGMRIGYESYYKNIRIRNDSYTDATAFKQAMSGVYLYYQRATDSSWYIQNKTIYRTTQLTANQTIRKTTDGLPNFTSLPTGYLQMGVDTEVQPSGGSVTYKSRSVSL